MITTLTNPSHRNLMEPDGRFIYSCGISQHHIGHVRDMNFTSVLNFYFQTFQHSFKNKFFFSRSHLIQTHQKHKKTQVYKISTANCLCRTQTNKRRNYCTRDLLVVEITVVVKVLPLDSSILKNSLLRQRRNLKTIEVLDDTEQILDLALDHTRWD